ncbi:hypothetical protein FOZ62_032047, partial [Perkinsus olseni]
SGLGRQLGKLKASQIKAFLSAVAGKPGGHLVLDPLINSGEIFPSLVFDALAQSLMRPSLSPAAAEGIARRLVDCQAEVSDEKWRSLVVVLPAETLSRLAVFTAGTTGQQQRCAAVVDRMQQILEGPGGDNLKDRYTAAVAQLAARGLPCDHWKNLVAEDSALAQVVGLSGEVSLARAQGGYPCEDLEGPLIAELNLEVDLEVAGQEWLVDFPPVLPCRDLYDAECSLVELMGAYDAHKLWFARRCQVAASMATSLESAKATVIATTTKKSPAGEAFEICVRLDVDYSTAVVELLGASFEAEGNVAVWWSTFTRLIDCCATVEGNLKIFSEVLDKILPSGDTQCPFQAFEKLALEALIPLCRLLDHLVRLNRLENAHSTRIVRMSRCLHDKIDSILRMDGPPSHRAPKLARDTMNLRFSLRTLANTVRKLKNTGGSTEVQNDEADRPTPSVDSLYPSQAPSSIDGRASAIRPFPAAKRSRLSHVPTPCT